MQRPAVHGAQAERHCVVEDAPAGCAARPDGNATASSASTPTPSKVADRHRRRHQRRNPARPACTTGRRPDDPPRRRAGAAARHAALRTPAEAAQLLAVKATLDLRSRPLRHRAPACGSAATSASPAPCSRSGCREGSRRGRRPQPDGGCSPVSRLDPASSRPSARCARRRVPRGCAGRRPRPPEAPAC
jgi:hypothetical protein